MLEAMLCDKNGERLISVQEYASLVEEAPDAAPSNQIEELLCPLCEQVVVLDNSNGEPHRFRHKYLNGTSSCCPNHDPQSWSYENRGNPLLLMRIKQREQGSFDFEIGFPKLNDKEVAALENNSVSLNLGSCTYDTNQQASIREDTVWLRYGMKPGAEPLYWNYKGIWPATVKRPVFNDSYAPLMLFKCDGNDRATANRVDKLHNELQPNESCLITYTTSTIKSRRPSRPDSLDPCVDALLREGLATSCSNVGHICDTNELLGVATISFSEKAFKGQHLRLPVFQYFL